jgi:hypothetical protein
LVAAILRTLLDGFDARLSARKVKDDVDKSMKQVQDKIDAEDPQKKGY